MGQNDIPMEGIGSIGVGLVGTAIAERLLRARSSPKRKQLGGDAYRLEPSGARLKPRAG